MEPVIKGRDGRVALQQGQVWAISRKASPRKPVPPRTVVSLDLMRVVYRTRFGVKTCEIGSFQRWAFRWVAFVKGASCRSK